jgi:hypothetical protein
MAKKRQTRRMSRRSKRYSRKMRGGALDEQELMQKGFTAEQIAALHNYGIDNMNLINMSLQQVNPQTNAPFTPQELIDSLNDVNNQEENEDDVQEGLDQPPPPEFNNINNNDINNHMDYNNMNFEQGPGLNMQDLGPYSPHSVTEEPYGGRRSRGRRRRSRNHKFRKSGRKMRSRKTYKGGACYGNGVGANAFDPNNSIFNTRELQLFPYKPN